MRRIPTSSALLAFLLIGCADHPATPLAPEGSIGALSDSRRDVRLVHRAPYAPQFADTVVVLDAVAGTPGRVALQFSDGSPFAALELGAESLVGATLDGRSIAAGETVRITLRRHDASRFLVQMEPAGLVFNPSAPAVVTFDYTLANDADLAASFQVRKRHQVGERWLDDVKVEHDARNKRIRGRVDDFTHYALAYP